MEHDFKDLLESKNSTCSISEEVGEELKSLLTTAKSGHFFTPKEMRL